MPLFKVVVELFPIEWSEVHNSNFLNESKPDQRDLIDVLSRLKGIYSFYNSEYEIIYIGKTKNNLWYEMKSAYMRPMSHYQRYVVHHPRGRYNQTKSGIARKLSRKSLYVWQAAHYFSAHEVDEGLIDDVERLLIRMMPNDVTNKRMEGNNSLEMHVPNAEG